MKCKLSTLFLVLLIQMNCANSKDFKNPIDPNSGIGFLTSAVLSFSSVRPTTSGTTATATILPSVTGELVAGSISVSANIDGSLTSARFASLSFFCVNPSGTLIAILGSSSNAYRRVDLSNSNVTTVTTTGNTFSSSGGCAFDSSGNIYFHQFSNCIFRISTANTVSQFAGCSGTGDTDGTGLGSQFRSINALIRLANGDFLVFDSTNKKIKRLTTGGVVTTLSGSGATGTTDGTAGSSTFDSFSFIAYDPNSPNFVYFLDQTRLRLRSISTSTGSTALIFASDQFSSSFSSSNVASSTTSCTSGARELFVRSDRIQLTNSPGLSLFLTASNELTTTLTSLQASNTSITNNVRQFCQVTKAGFQTPAQFLIGSTTAQNSSFISLSNPSVLDSSGRLYFAFGSALMRFTVPTQ